MTPEDLRRLLQRPASLDAIRAAATSGKLASILRTPFFDHITDVYARLERTAADSAEAWPLKLAVLVHEEPPARAAELVARAGFSDVSDVVLDVLRGFGAVWKPGNALEVEAYVRAHTGQLTSLLLFELAHEGTPTPSMRLAADAAGLTAEFEGWVSRLAAGEEARLHASRAV